jgi:hypothetical protein
MHPNQKLLFSISLFSFWLSLDIFSCAYAQTSTPDNAPPQLKKLIAEIDGASSRGDIKGVMGFYSSKFTHGDGLTRQAMEQSLKSFWQRYPKLSYQTKLKSWRSNGKTIIAETVTRITGLSSDKTSPLAINAAITSRQHIRGTQITHQEILSERTQMTSGKKPPQVEFRLPQQVKVGEKYVFDAIVNEPLGNNFLLGTAIEETIKPNKYLNPTPINLELLSTGGLFKTGTAPSQPVNQWISAVIVRDDGVTMITQRLKVVRN